MDFDRDGIDLEVKAGRMMRPSLGLQLKATINLGDLVNGTAHTSTATPCARPSETNV
jgi:hypothetical protein